MKRHGTARTRRGALGVGEVDLARERWSLLGEGAVLACITLTIVIYPRPVRISRVAVENFLCFRHLDVDLDTSLQLVAGPNNAGKSSLVRLIEAFFSDPSSADLLELTPRNSYYQDAGPRTLSSILVWFTDLTQDEEEAFSEILRKDGTMWLQIRCSRAGMISHRASKASAEQAARLYAEALQRVHFVQIPSVRVAGSEGSREFQAMERLLSTLETILVRSGSARSTSLQQEYRSKSEPLESLVGSILNDSAAVIGKDLPFEEQTIHFSLPDSRVALRALLESAVIESVGDAVIPISQRGTGFQSALVLGVLKWVATREASEGANLFFAIEEPEAFLHPQTQRAMAQIIEQISEDAQIMVTTHSSVFVDTFGISQIMRLPHNSGGSSFTWGTPLLDETDAGRLTRYCSAANSELVFANAVIFVEGEGDRGVVEKLLSTLCEIPGGHYALGITVIDAGGIGKIRYLVQLAELFNIRSYVLADADTIRKAGSGRRELLSVLEERLNPPTASDLTALRNAADVVSKSESNAIANQVKHNQILSKYDTFVLSSDLEGLLLDLYGPSGIADVLGPSGEGMIDAATVATFSAPGGFEDCARWLGSRGWNSDRKPTGKLEPHLAPLLVDLWKADHGLAGDPLKPLTEWLQAIVDGAKLSPV